ncbi:MAG: hypothetical protein M1508_11815 [Nitrospirae bacterium]|nr:hypothetical protein [Nitrospirota bacterium]MCL5423308.1 hypothetical protein [Nitrospirota bacterium]
MKKNIFNLLLISLMLGCGGGGGGGSTDSTAPLSISLVKKIAVTTDAEGGSAVPLLKSWKIEFSRGKAAVKASEPEMQRCIFMKRNRYR